MVNSCSASLIFMKLFIVQQVFWITVECCCVLGIGENNKEDRWVSAHYYWLGGIKQIR